MKITSFFASVVAAVALSSASGAATVPTQKVADPSDILKTETLGWLRIGLSEAAVARNLTGSPQKGKDTLWAALGTYVQEWKYPEHGLTLHMESERRGQPKQVLNFWVRAPSTLKTQRGISIGSTEAEVAKAYKAWRDPESSVAGKAFVAGTIYGGLIFNFREGKVESIFVGAAAE